MKRAYLAISYANRKNFDKLVAALKAHLLRQGIDLFIFVDEYNFRADEEKKMMQTAFAEIDASDLLIAELTTKSIGVGIELGYAYAKNIPILYLRQEKAAHSTTASGSAHGSIFYTDQDDLLCKIDVGLLRLLK